MSNQPPTSESDAEADIEQRNEDVWFEAPVASNYRLTEKGSALCPVFGD